MLEKCGQMDGRRTKTDPKTSPKQSAIFELVRDINKTNSYKENCPTHPGGHFHDDWAKNVTSRVKMRPSPGYGRERPPIGFWVGAWGIVWVKSIQEIIGPCFSMDRTIFELNSYIIVTNLLTTFHEDPTINVASTINRNHFKLVQDNTGTNLLTKFHDNRKMWPLEKKIPRQLAAMFFQPTGIIFKLVQDIIGMNLLTKFHGDRTINVASRVKDATPLGSHTINVASREKCPPPGGHVFQPTGIILELIPDIIGKNVLTKFHEDRTINVASRVLTRKNAPPLGSHVFQANVTIFELIQDIIETNFLTKFHEDCTINVVSIVKNAPPPGTIGNNILTKFHEDRTINVASIVLTRKNAPPLGSHVFQANVTIFELIQNIIETKLLTKFHED
ncbi:hypothetical protein DPMN_105757 [Dreissena polymorpha]|uniref:Uncharacterized protein n=1 Tax=Dreissena polymorpha TaxID=45954 RepID=A0A9D4QI15_DREPO|nr:hypothetical protein DPMN_105757 [Dreissena polymorpha]